MPRQQEVRTYGLQTPWLYLYSTSRDHCNKELRRESTLGQRVYDELILKRKTVVIYMQNLPKELILIEMELSHYHLRRKGI